MADSGPGGMTVLSLPAFESWKHERAGRKEKPAQQPIWAHKQQAAKYAQNGRDDDPILMLHMGCYTFTKAPDLSSSGTVMYMVRSSVSLADICVHELSRTCLCRVRCMG